MIPAKLSDWNYSIIEELVDKGYLETDRFEFKLEINSREPNYYKKLARTSSAFANTFGGFIIFGVRDMGSSGKAQIMGIPKSDDLSKHFGDKIKSVSPTLFFGPLNPPIDIPNSSNVLFVVEIPQSSERPHMVEHTFYYRTNTGNEIMSYEQVRESFLNYDERRTKLSLLYMELLYNKEIATKLVESTQTPFTSEKYVSAYFDMITTTSLLPDVYSLIQTDRSFIRKLFELRMKANEINSGTATLDRKWSVPGIAREHEIENHLQHLRTEAPTILRLIVELMSTLESKFQLRNPFQA